MPFESMPDDLVALRFPVGEDEEPIKRIALPVQESVIGPAFRQSNFVVSAIAGGSKQYRPEPKYSPLNDIADTPYLWDYGDEFVGAQSSAEVRDIKARIDRELNDKRIIEAGGWYGTVAGIGAGLIDPLNLLPGGAFYRGTKAIGKAASIGMAAGVGTSFQEGGLHATQQTRTIEESIWSIGGATVLGALLEAGSDVDRGPVVEAAAQMVAEGRIEAAGGLMVAHALGRRKELMEAARARNLPLGVAVMPLTGNCLSSRLVDGDLVTVDPVGQVTPGDIMVFAGNDEPLHFAKVFLGITTCKRLKASLGYDHPGPAVVCWMPNPESFILVSLADLAYAARVTGKVDRHSGYMAFDAWPFTEGQRADIDHFGESIQPKAFICFGSPPIAQIAA